MFELADIGSKARDQKKPAHLVSLAAVHCKTLVCVGAAF
jgi:hypothetical protein